jgi:hypothetical protein
MTTSTDTTSSSEEQGQMDECLSCGRLMNLDDVSTWCECQIEETREFRAALWAGDTAPGIWNGTPAEYDALLLKDFGTEFLQLVA